MVWRVYPLSIGVATPEHKLSGGQHEGRFPEGMNPWATMIRDLMIGGVSVEAMPTLWASSLRDAKQRMIARAIAAKAPFSFVAADSVWHGSDCNPTAQGGQKAMFRVLPPITCSIEDSFAPRQCSKKAIVVST